MARLSLNQYEPPTTASATTRPMMRPVCPKSDPIPRIKPPIKASSTAVFKLFFILVLALRPDGRFHRNGSPHNRKWVYRSDPALAPEVDELADGGSEDQGPREAVAVSPRQLGDDPEVLAVEADDERRWQEDRRHDREPLHHLVLVVGDLRLVVVTDAADQITGRLQPFAGAQQLVVRGAEVELDLVGEQLLRVVELDSVVDHGSDRVAGRREGATDVEHVVTQ